MRIGDHQVEMLVMLASPERSLVVADKVALSLVKRGLLKLGTSGGFAAITPAGLRALADEMECGRVDDALQRIAKDVAERKRRAGTQRNAA